METKTLKLSENDFNLVFGILSKLALKGNLTVDSQAQTYITELVKEIIKKELNKGGE